MTTGTSFHSIFLIFFVNRIYYSYATRLQNFEGIRPGVGELLYKWLKLTRNDYRYKFSLDFLNFLFGNRIYYSYATRLQNFKGIRPSVGELLCKWCKWPRNGYRYEFSLDFFKF